MNGEALCKDAFSRSPVYAQTRPFTVFSPSVPQFDLGLVPEFPNFIIPNMVQFLPRNASRIGLYIRIQEVGTIIATSGNGQGVALANALWNQDTTEFYLTPNDPDSFITDPWFIAWFGAPFPLAPQTSLVTGCEIVKV